jgi:alpha/beta hydrolase fold
LRITAIRDRPFPFDVGAPTIQVMPTLVQREADLSFRSARDFVRPRVIWPPDPVDGSPIAVFIGERESVFEAAHALCLEGGAVVMALQTTSLDEATIAVEWVGDHAGLLGADPARLVVAGGGLAATAALYARDEGWPPILRQLLFGPERGGWPPAGTSLAGAAPATIVDAPVYASRLRDAGVEVEELAVAEPLSLGWLATPHS